jgi:recombination protein RecA
VWREARDITVGDTLVSAAFGAEEAGGGGDLAEDEAVLLGYLATWFSPDGEPEIVPEVSEILAGPMGVEVEPGAAEYLLPDAATRVMLAEAYGLHLDAIDPGVPHCVRVAGAKAQRAFLSALIDGGGGVDAAGTVSFETYAEAMARQVQLMLYGFGIPAGLSSESDESAAGHRWKVTIDPAVTTRFLVEIGFRSQRRHARAAGARPVAGDSHLAVADVEDLAGRRYTCEPVTAVRDAGYEPTFDIVVPASHSFVANGILSHNTTLALHVVAEAQRNGGVAAFIDAEHALDPSYAKALGVDIDELYISQPDTGEQALEIADMLIRSGALDVVVIDSVAALVPRAELEGDMGDTHVGLQARLMSQALRKLAGTINRSETTAVFINQLREKIGVMFGSPETTPGGRALKFYSSVRIDVRRIESIKQGTESVGNRVRAKIVKNKVAPPFRVAEFDIMFGSGISREGSLIDVAVEHGIVKKSGAWYTFDGDQLGQGREKAKEFLRDNAEIAVQLQDRVLRTVGVVAAESSDDEPTADDNPADRESLDVDD